MTVVNFVQNIYENWQVLLFALGVIVVMGS